mmetsp:Transcript_15113/g.21190  ORF Transcript_15113/g.21190 Transcript_15113/m.21190 type:complete len:143 (+) Transcript_15113:101-529(+)
MSKEAEEIGSRKSEIDEVKNAQVITAMAEPMNLLHKCPHCTAVVQTAYGFNGGVRCGSCGRTFHVVPVASVIKPGHAAKKVKSEWQTGTYQCTKDMLTCCCVGFVPCGFCYCLWNTGRDGFDSPPTTAGLYFPFCVQSLCCT